MIRLFIALKIESEIQDKFNTIVTDFRNKDGNVKWVDAKNLHLTLKFLGNTDYNLVDTISSQLEKKVQSFQAIESEFTSLGGFPNLSKPKVIWADIEKNKDEIITLAESINSSLAEVGFGLDNKLFTPHLTLGRVKSYDNITALTDYLKDYQFEKTPITFCTVQLIQSKLTQTGPVYKTLTEITLSERFGG